MAEGASEQHSLQDLYEEAWIRVHRVISSGAAQSQLPRAFDVEQPLAERLALSRRLNTILKERVRVLKQTASARGLAPPAPSDDVSMVVTALVKSLGESKLHLDASSAPSSSSSTTGRQSEPEDFLYTFPSASKTSTTTTTVKQANKSTYTGDDLESDPIQHLNSYQSVLEVAGPSSPVAEPFTPISRSQLVRNAHQGGLDGHWFMHMGLRHSEMRSVSISIQCSAMGIQITAPLDAARRGLKDIVPLDLIKSCTLGMASEPFRAWHEWEQYRQQQALAVSMNDDNASTVANTHTSAAAGSNIRNADDDDVTAVSTNVSSSAISKSKRFVRRSVTLTLREAQESLLFKVWFSDITVIFTTTDAYNAFITSLIHWLPLVQYGVDVTTVMLPPVSVPPTLVNLLARCVAEGELKTDEAELLSTWRVFPADYFVIKQRMLSPFSPELLGYEDLMAASPSVDFLQVIMIVKFFETKGWVSLHTCYRCL